MDPERQQLLVVSYAMDTMAAAWHLRSRWKASRGLSSLSNSYMQMDLSKLGRMGEERKGRMRQALRNAQTRWACARCRPTPGKDHHDSKPTFSLPNRMGWMAALHPARTYPPDMIFPVSVTTMHLTTSEWHSSGPCRKQEP